MFELLLREVAATLSVVIIENYIITNDGDAYSFYDPLTLIGVGR
jgi:hypothetical protein